VDLPEPANHPALDRLLAPGNASVTLGSPGNAPPPPAASRARSRREGGDSIGKPEGDRFC
jgi:hypothetical protein